MSLESHVPPFFVFNDSATAEIYTLSLHDALPIFAERRRTGSTPVRGTSRERQGTHRHHSMSNYDNAPFEIHVHRSEEHTSELQPRQYLVCRLLLEKKKSQISPSGSESHFPVSAFL